jgi:hypothetical protein
MSHHFPRTSKIFYPVCTTIKYTVFLAAVSGLTEKVVPGNCYSFFQSGAVRNNLRNEGDALDPSTPNNER